MLIVKDLSIERLDKKIFENISKEAWQLWLEQQTMLINEKQLSMADSQSRKYLAEQMNNFLFHGNADAATGYTPPKNQPIMQHTLDI